MHPVMLRWRAITIHSYPFMQYIGLTLGVIAGNQAAHYAGLDAFRVFVATILLLFPALAGARLLHVATNWSTYRVNTSEIWNTQSGGAAQYGGILLAVPLSIPLLRAFDIPFGAFWDVSSVTLMVGMVFTRIGCLLNGCCTGRSTHSWLAMYLPDSRGKWGARFPTQLLEAGWAAMLLVIGLSLWPSLPFDGALFIFVAGGYAAGRLIMESMREVSEGAPAFTIHHVISLLIIVLCIAALTIRRTQ